MLNLSLSVQMPTKIFISHSSEDIEYVKNIVKLLEDIGVGEEQIFCSSVPGYNIPVNEDIYDYLQKQFEEYELYVIFLLSDNYYKSVACLNEMGMAWALRSDYITILTPTFNYESIKGAINPRKIGIKLDKGSDELKSRLNEFVEVFINVFDLPSLSFVKWERIRKTFIEKNREIINTNEQNEDADFVFDTSAVPDADLNNNIFLAQRQKKKNTRRWI